MDWSIIMSSKKKHGIRIVNIYESYAKYALFYRRQ